MCVIWWELKLIDVCGDSICVCLIVLEFELFMCVQLGDAILNFIRVRCFFV